MEPALFPHQATLLRDAQQAYLRGARAVLMVMPTGAGKTFTFAKATQLACEKGRRVLLLAHRRELIEQISRALWAFEVRHGIIAPDFDFSSCDVQIASIPTLVRRWYPGRYAFDLIVIDEAHHAVSGSGLATILDGLPDAKRLGVTATPCRLDGRGLGIEAGGFFDALVQGPSVLELIEQGYLARPVVYAPPESTGPDLRSVKVVAGDYAPGQLEKVMNQSPLIGDAVSHYQRLCPGQPAIAFCVTVEHAEQVAWQFQQAGFRAAALSGQTQDGLRAQMIKNLGQGTLHVLTSCNVVSEGTDIPIVSAAILLRPTASKALAMQQIGRVLRIHPGKEKALILDHAGNTRRHGLPTEPSDWTLEGRPKGARRDFEGARTKECPNCGVSLATNARQCPECGQAFSVADLPLPVAGDLEEVDAVAVARAKRQEVAQARTLDELQMIGRQRGYRAGWAHHVWRERQHNEEWQQRRGYG
ncbi:MAG: DEAD/DEAH box helicase family protein [Gammaproteobacteria bacterium]|nr:DEAD/DEAH box helicase family protein [Gammaproteobacteria bacterium]